MVYLIITIINILGGLVALFALVAVAKRYLVAPKMSKYLFFLVMLMCLLIAGQVYSLVISRSNWKVKFLPLIIWVSALYWAWAVRFSSIKKDTIKNKIWFYADRYIGFFDRNAK